MKKTKKTIFTIFILLIISSLFLTACEKQNQNKLQQITQDKPIIGGERDGRGCLGPAGYSYDEKVNACIRKWELNDNQKEAARIAVESVGYEKGLTITDVLAARCPGCFTVTLRKINDEIVTISMTNWEVDEKK